MKSIAIVLWCLLVAQWTYGQQKLTGTVKDENGEVLPGVNVLIKGTGLGTATLVDGTYSVTVTGKETLVFSYVGYETRELNVDNRTVLDVVLKQEIEDMDEVVITAIGIKQQKKKIGYSTELVDGGVLSQIPTVNAAMSLAGQVAGLQVSSPTGIFQTPEFELRGKTPLIVVDGVPVETDFFDISSANIESINVLKGTAASALYGARGKDGALLITTKSAQQDGVEINFQTNNMFTAGFCVFPETQHSYGAGLNGQYEFWDGAGGGVQDGDMQWGPKLDAGLNIAQWNSPIRDKVTGEIIPWWGNVEGTQYDDRSRYERVPIDWVSHDNLRNFLGTGIVSNSDLTFAYKGARARYYLTLQYAYQKGQVPNTKLNSGGLTFKASYDLANNVQLDASLSYNKVLSPNYPRYGYQPYNHMYNILLWMGDDVDIEELEKHHWVPGMEGYRQASYNYGWYNNPYFVIENFSQRHDRNVLHGQLRLNYQILPNLNEQGRASLRNYALFEDMKIPKSYMSRSEPREGEYRIWNTNRMNVDADILASYSQSLTDEIGLTVNVGSSVFYRSLREEYMSTDGLIVPEVYNMSNSQNPVTAENTLTEKSIRSVYGTVNLDLYDAFFLTVTGRNDWSSTLSKAHNSYFYPSVSLSTMVSEYVPMPKWMDYMKLMVSWAQVSSDLNPYEIASVYEPGTTYGSTPSVTYPSSLVNPEIEPQKTTSWEVGLSTALWRDRVALDVTYYHDLDENQIIDLEVSEASGFSSRKVNGNEYTTNGWEVSVNTHAIRKGPFKWDFRANWSRRVKKLTEIYGGLEKYGDLREGDRADSYYATGYQYSADGQLILDNTGMPVRDAYSRYFGHTDPDWRLGWQNTFTYKHFTLGIDIDGVWGGVMFSKIHERLWRGGKHPDSVEEREREYEAGEPVYVPDGVVVTGGELVRDVNGNVISDTRTYAENTTAVSYQTWCMNYPANARVSSRDDDTFATVFDRSYFKLRRVALSYDFKHLLPEHSRVKGLTATIFANNVAMWKKIPYIDPDFNVNGNDEGSQDPTARYVGFGLTMKF